jgi:hypothetical protein
MGLRFSCSMLGNSGGYFWEYAYVGIAEGLFGVEHAR